MSFESQVKPSPIASIRMSSFFAARCSPKRAVECLMNWNIRTRKSRPQARNRIPSAAVVFPFPSPVLTMTSP